MKTIEIYDYHGKGYNPLLISREWQVAYLNYAEAESLEQIDKLDVHHQTDEVFILLEGHSVLIGATIEGDRIEYDLIDMKPGVSYNIPMDSWHKIAMSEGSRVLIVEKSNTHLSDYEFYHLSPEQIEQLRSEVRECIQNNRL